MKPPQPFRSSSLLVGGLIAGLGISQLVDDAGLVKHPWWIVFALALIIASAAAVLATVRSFRGVSSPSDGDR